MNADEYRAKLNDENWILEEVIKIEFLNFVAGDSYKNVSWWWLLERIWGIDVVEE